jgi:signal transduction histidine kinase
MGTLYQHLAQGQLAIERGLQVISMILNEVRSQSIDTTCFTFLSARKATLKAVDEYSFETEGERRKVKVIVAKDFTFKGDETLYLFVLFNLIKNALYYFALRPQATLTLTVDGGAVIVRDTGPGIDSAQLPSLFEPFKTSGKSGGTGLGLAYCQRVMRNEAR